LNFIILVLSLNIDVLLDDLLVIISEYWNHLLET
jgi:hypothetical protein